MGLKYSEARFITAKGEAEVKGGRGRGTPLARQGDAIPDLNDTNSSEMNISFDMVALRHLYFGKYLRVDFHSEQVTFLPLAASFLA